MRQKPDATPGNYYVTATRGKRVAYLAGPFRNDHAGAQAMVERARAAAVEADHWMQFAAFGTARCSSAYEEPGKLNSVLGLDLGRAA